MKFVFFLPLDQCPTVMQETLEAFLERQAYNGEVSTLGFDERNIELQKTRKQRSPDMQRDLLLGNAASAIRVEIADTADRHLVLTAFQSLAKPLQATVCCC